MPTLALSRDEVDALAERFETRSPQELLAWAADRLGDGLVLTCSWQMGSSVLIDMIHRQELQVRVVELDTGLLFPETYATREALMARYGIRVERVEPRRSVAEQEADEGPRLWLRDPERCCALRKVEPFERALRGAEAWITGIRRDQGPGRARARALELDEARGLVKVQPLVGWTEEDVRGYLYAHDVPYNRLHDRGYPSIGCMPCTRAIEAGEDPRSGRWAGSVKTECGLHR